MKPLNTKTMSSEALCKIMDTLSLNSSELLGQSVSCLIEKGEISCETSAFMLYFSKAEVPQIYASDSVQ